jgi:hypothetical protein
MAINGYGIPCINLLIGGEKLAVIINSSPYALEAHHHLGFTDTDTEQLTDDMRYITMRYTKR